MDEANAQAVATLALQVGYRGAGFAGFAAQPGQRTVAGELTHALEVYLRRPVEIVCAGRTDAGVHALGQVVSLPVNAQERSLAARNLLQGLTALTPDDISLRGLWAAPASFSARFDARSRRYRYRICDGPLRPALAWDFSWWHKQSLDAARMDEAAQCLVGEHDFVSFCKTASAEGKPTCRHVDSIHVWRTEELGESAVLVEIEANAFLHSMVRTIVGSLAEIGRGKRDGAWLASALAACDRRAAGPTAPAQGLTFVSVSYPDGLLTSWDDTSQ